MNLKSLNQEKKCRGFFCEPFITMLNCCHNGFRGSSIKELFSAPFSNDKSLDTTFYKTVLNCQINGIDFCIQPKIMVNDCSREIVFIYCLQTQNIVSLHILIKYIYLLVFTRLKYLLDYLDTVKYPTVHANAIGKTYHKTDLLSNTFAK